MNAEHINPFLIAIASVFEQMLGVKVDRQMPFLRKACDPRYQVIGVIGLSGRMTGTVAVGLPSDVAIAITAKLIGEQPKEVNAQVTDAVGEVTNMIAGAAKAQLEEWNLSLGLPTVVVGSESAIAFPSRAVPISIPFSSPFGPMVVDVGIAAA